MEVIAAIDIIDGRCVRLRQGDYDQATFYQDNPVDIAKRLSDAGLQRLHLVDLDGAKAGYPVNVSVIEKIAQSTSLVIDVGGGLKSGADFARVFNAGAAMATVGTLAATNRELTQALLKQWGPSRLILGADGKDGKVAVSGWNKVTDLPLVDYICGYLCEGFTTVICTDISKDGMLSGPSVDLYREIIAKATSYGLMIRLIASGGVTSIQDLHELTACGCTGAIVGKALHEGLLTVKELSEFQKG